MKHIDPYGSIDINKPHQNKVVYVTEKDFILF